MGCSSYEDKVAFVALPVALTDKRWTHPRSDPIVFSDRVTQFLPTFLDEAGDSAVRRCFIEAEHSSGATAYGALVLFDDDVDLLSLAAASLVWLHGVESLCILAILVDRSFLWHLVPRDCLFEEPVCQSFRNALSELACCD